MFDIEQSIAHWRQRLLQAGLANASALDELESHLREEIDRLTQSGLTVEEAFHLASDRLGPVVGIQQEFAKTHAHRTTRWALWKCAILQFLGLPSHPAQLSDSVQLALAFGRQESRAFRHSFVGTEHVLLGLMRCNSPVLSGAFKNLRIDPENVRRLIEEYVGVGKEGSSKSDPSLSPLTPRAKRSLALAVAEAAGQRQKRIGPEHLFLGLLREGNGVAALVLRSLGVNLQSARHEVIQEIQRQNPPYV